MRVLLSLCLASVAVSVTGVAVAADPHSSGSAPAVKQFAKTTIGGVTVNSAGKPVDDVLVEVMDPDTQETVASGFTYASSRLDEPQHGFFALPVPSGTYVVKFSKPGLPTVWKRGVQVSSQSAELGKVMLAEKLFTGFVKTEDESVKVGQKVVVEAVVGLKNTQRDAEGKLVLFKQEGRRFAKVDSAPVTDSGLYKFVVTKDVSAGTNVFQVRFVSKGIKETVAKDVVVKVTKVKKSR